jgi:cytochrome c556
MRLSCVLAVALLGFGSLAHAETKPEDAIKYRQAVYRTLLWNWMPLNAMSRGRVPFDAAEFARRSERIAALSGMLLEGFPAGSGTGAKTDAKPEIWSHFPDFSTKMKNFETEAAKLATVAKAGNEEATKAQFGKVGGTCKACHDKYKADD